MLLRSISLYLVLVPIAATAQLTDQAAETIDRFAQARERGMLGEALRLSNGFLKNATPQQVEAASMRLRERHQIQTSLVDLAAQTRVELVVQGHGGRLPRPTPLELSATILALDRRYSELVEPARRELATGYPALIPDDVLDEKIEAIGPLITQVHLARLILNDFRQIADSVRPADRQRMEEAARLAIAQKADERKKIEIVADELAGRLVDLSLLRLASATAVVNNQAADFARRFRATEKAAETLARIHENWDAYKKWKQREGGLDPEIEKRWRLQEEQLREHSAPFLEKVHHFSEGTRWWLRGRYGVGTAAGGMKKVMPGEGRHDQAIAGLHASPLLMPRQIPRPQDPLAIPRPYPVARRHMEWWRVQPVDLTMTQHFVLTGKPSGANSLIVRLPLLRPRFATNAALNSTMQMELAQLVGYYEYEQALAHFERLIELATPAELRALDDMIGEDDRFAVHSNLSGKYDRLDPATTLRIPERPIDPRAARAHERRGLAWVMALARIEYAAMRSVYTLEDFAAFTPTAIEREAYLELLLDGARQHYYETRTEFQSGNLFGPFGPNATIDAVALVRLTQVQTKLHLAEQMLSSFRHFTAGSLNNPQTRELTEALAWIALQQTMIANSLRRTDRDEVLNRRNTRQDVEPFQMRLNTNKKNAPKVPTESSQPLRENRP